MEDFDDMEVYNPTQLVAYLFDVDSRFRGVTPVDSKRTNWDERLYKEVRELLDFGWDISNLLTEVEMYSLKRKKEKIVEELAHEMAVQEVRKILASVMSEKATEGDAEYDIGVDVDKLVESLAEAYRPVAELEVEKMIQEPVAYPMEILAKVTQLAAVAAGKKGWLVTESMTRTRRVVESEGERRRRGLFSRGGD